NGSRTRFQRFAKKIYIYPLAITNRIRTFAPAQPGPSTGEVAEWSNAAVLKTVEGHTSGGSNPSLSARSNPAPHQRGIFIFSAWPSVSLRRSVKNQNGSERSERLDLG